MTEIPLFVKRMRKILSNKSNDALAARISVIAKQSRIDGYTEQWLFYSEIAHRLANCKCDPKSH